MMTLWREQSDILARFGRIRAIAEEVFGPGDAARAWLRESNGTLNNQSPLALLDTEESALRVEAVLGRIAHGIVE